MKSDQQGEKANEVGVELKYCEHCGGLWVRERNAGVYCDKCLPKVADLPQKTKKRRNPTLPVGPHTMIEDYELEIEMEDLPDFEAAGGL